MTRGNDFDDSAAGRCSFCAAGRVPGHRPRPGGDHRDGSRGTGAVAIAIDITIRERLPGRVPDAVRSPLPLADAPAPEPGPRAGTLRAQGPTRRNLHQARYPYRPLALLPDGRTGRVGPGAGAHDEPAGHAGLVLVGRVPDIRHARRRRPRRDHPTRRATDRQRRRLQAAGAPLDDRDRLHAVALSR